MEYPTYEPSHWNCLLTAPAIFSYPIIHENYVHWTQNPESHFFTADLPGVRKEEIKVEVVESTEPARSFIRKFRLPGMINVDGISAGYEDGVLTVTVPRSITSRGLFIDPAAVPERLETLARAA